MSQVMSHKAKSGSNKLNLVGRGQRWTRTNKRPIWVDNGWKGGGWEDDRFRDLAELCLDKQSGAGKERERTAEQSACHVRHGEGGGRGTGGGPHQ